MVVFGSARGEVVPQAIELLFNLKDSVLRVYCQEFFVAVKDEWVPVFWGIYM